MTNSDYLLQHLLKKSAGLYPDRTAVRADGASITYGLLWEKSNKLANALIMAGMNPREVVGIYMHKSIETVISMFAVLLAGGAYIPLDSHYSPVARIHTIIRVSRMSSIITTFPQWCEVARQHDAGQDNYVSRMKVFLVESLLQDSGADISAPPSDERENRYYVYHDYISPVVEQASTAISEDLAYVLYTSGSTGIPKGVMLSHLNALTFIRWALSCCRPECGDVFSSFAPFQFDLSIFDLFAALASGACMTIVPAGLMGNPRGLVEWATRQKVTFWYSVPSVWMSILNYAAITGDDLRSLKYILFAGEVFPAQPLKRLMLLLPHAKYYNFYGPTETNVCTYHQVQSAEDVGDKPVPIGKACENTEILVLNAQDKPVDVGEEGELLARGTIVSKGYYNDPERTQNAFRVSPLPWHQGALFYKTADIVRRCAGDVYEYVGRKDLMVKCAGYRIELQEIEYALYKHDRVEEAVVVPVIADYEHHQVRLFAFIKVKAGSVFSAIELKQSLTELLPKYMIPDFLVEINAVPKNSNGKVDRPLLAKMAQKEILPEVVKC